MPIRLIFIIFNFADMDRLASQIITALSNALKPEKAIPLHEPFFLGKEKEYIIDCLETRYVSSIGSYVDRFERDLAAFTGHKHAVAVVNGTSALHASLVLSDVEPGDEVLIPSLTFVATANAVAYCKAVPHFVDSCETTLGIAPEPLEMYLKKITKIENNTCINKITGRPIKAMIPVHIFGMPGHLDSLSDICKRYGLTMIEDAAESLGSYYKKKHTGHHGRFAVFSFNGNKTITTGGGGAVVCNDSSSARQLKHMTTTARVPDRFRFIHDRTGYNYRMPNINAALGCAQLEQLPEFLKRKRKLADRYRILFESIKGVYFLWERPHVKSNFWLNTLLLEKPDEDCLNTILVKTNESGIQTRPAWALIHKLPMYQDCPAMELHAAQSLEKRVINIPSSINLTAAKEATNE